MIFQIGPVPNAVSCRLNPTRLGGAPHCSPSVVINFKRFTATGSDLVLRQLQDNRHTAQSRGITVDGVISGRTVRITSVQGPIPIRRPTVIRRTQTVARQVTRPSEARARTAFRPVFASLVQEPEEARGFVHKRIGKFVKKAGRKVIRSAVGAIPIVGGFAKEFIPGGSAPGPQFFPSPGPALPQPVQFMPRRRFSQTPVQLPSTPGITTPAERSVGPDFQAVQGAFGLAAMAPFAMQRVHLDCPKGMVLGRDDLCYPKQVLRRNSKFRKWRSGPRPPVSAADAKMIRRLGAARAAVERLAKDVDLQTKKKVNPK